MRVFLDSSAFAKRYIRETGTAEVLDWCDRASELALSGVALAEIVAAFCRLRRDGVLSPRDYDRLKANFLEDIRDVAVCDLTPPVMASAIRALERSPLRGMDAIHIGSAVAIGADVFLSADRKQHDAALAAGLESRLV